MPRPATVTVESKRSGPSATRVSPAEHAAGDRTYRRPKQARGVATFEQILDAAHATIEERGISGFSLYDVADRAGVASGSTYHFFPSMTALFAALVERYDGDFARSMLDPLTDAEAKSWQAIVTALTERGRTSINQNRPALLLILGPGQTWQSRLVDTEGDTRIAHAMVEALRRFFVVPSQPDPTELLHNCIRCLEGLWQLSFQRYGSVIDEMATETNRVILAYLGLYWPKYLEPAKASDPGTA